MTRPVLPDPKMSEILDIMFDAWVLHENSYVIEPGADHGRYHIRKEDAFITVAKAKLGEGDSVAIIGYLIYLFDYWSNDIQSAAARLGIGLDRDENGRLIRREVPEAPSLDHWWHENEWHAPDPEDGLMRVSS